MDGAFGEKGHGAGARNEPSALSVWNPAGARLAGRWRMLRYNPSLRLRMPATDPVGYTIVMVATDGKTEIRV